MPIMQEAIPKEDWERMDKGLPPIKRPIIQRPEPEPLQGKDQISLKGIKFVNLISVKRENRKNKEGMNFIGYLVKVEVKDGAGVKTLGGWAPEADWLEFLRNHRGRINMEALQV